MSRAWQELCSLLSKSKLDILSHDYLLYQHMRDIDLQTSFYVGLGASSSGGLGGASPYAPSIFMRQCE